MKRVLSIVFLLLTCIVAQVHSGTLELTVLRQSGAVSPRVRVDIRGPERKILTCDKNGKCIVALKGGLYDIHFREGRRRAVIRDVAIPEGKETKKQTVRLSW